MTDSRWIIASGDGRYAMTVEATGRRKALALAQDKLGGDQHGTGGFYDALVGHGRYDELGPLRAFTPEEAREHGVQTPGLVMASELRPGDVYFAVYTATGKCVFRTRNQEQAMSIAARDPDRMEWKEHTR